MRETRSRHRLARFAATAALALPAALIGAGTAHAESAPGCGSTVQIGDTAYIVEGGQTFASVKQFVGCGLNWGYIYVWQGWRNTHSSWSMCIAIGDATTNYRLGLNCGGSIEGDVELWTSGTNTVQDCTFAIGDDDNSPAYAETNVVC